MGVYFPLKDLSFFVFMKSTGEKIKLLYFIFNFIFNAVAGCGSV